jgi:hypothetical protein
MVSIRGKACLVCLLGLLIILLFVSQVSAQEGKAYWSEDFNYTDVSQMQAAGWTLTRPTGIKLAASSVILDGMGGDCAIHHAASFSQDVLDWKAEVRTMWLGHGHSVLSVFVYTEKHWYGWAADGYYKEYSLYRDNIRILHFGSYAEKANQYVTLTMVREANTFSFYFNGELINTYNEEDTSTSRVTSLGLVSPWKGDTQYDYIQIGEPNAAFASSSPASQTSSGFPIVPVAVGGGIAAAVGIGAAVYYFVVAGGSTGASAGAGAGSVDAAGTGELGSGDGGSGGGYPTGDGASEGASGGLSAGGEGEAPVPDSGDAGGGFAEGTGTGAEGPAQNTSTEGSGAVIGSAAGGAAGSGGLTLEQINNFNQAMGALQNMIETSQATAMSAASDRPSGGGGGGLGSSNSSPSIFDSLTAQGQQLINQVKMQDSFDQAKYDQYMEQLTKMTQQIEKVIQEYKNSSSNVQYLGR